MRKPRRPLTKAKKASNMKSTQDVFKSAAPDAAFMEEMTQDPHVYERVVKNNGVNNAAQRE